MDIIPDMLHSLTSSHHLHLGTHLKFLDQWRSITSNRFVLNMVQGHHLQLRCHPLLFHNFKWFNIKAVQANHPIIQEEVDELLAKGGIEPSTGGVGFYFSLFVVCKNTVGL